MKQDLSNMPSFLRNVRKQRIYFERLLAFVNCTGWVGGVLRHPAFCFAFRIAGVVANLSTVDVMHFVGSSRCFWQGHLLDTCVQAVSPGFASLL